MTDLDRQSDRKLDQDIDVSSPPIADRRPVERVHHGDVFIDDYEWLRDKDGADTVAYLEAENDFTKARTAHLEGLRDDVFSEIKARTLETDLSVPRRSGDYWYYSRTEEGHQYPLVCRTPIAQADDWTPPRLEPGQPVEGEQIMLDGNALAEGHDFFSFGGSDVSLDGSMLAYSIDVAGDERYTIAVKDLRTGALLDDSVENTYPSVVWSADGKYLFYSTYDDTWRPDKVHRHELGTPTSADVLVWHEPDGRFWSGVSRTTSDRYLLLDIHSKITAEVRVLDAGDPTGEFRLLVPRENGVDYEVEHAVVAGADRFLVVHNKGAENFALGIGATTLSSLDDLEPVIEPSDAVRVSNVSASERAVAVDVREAGLPQVRIFRLGPDGLGHGSNIAFDEPMFDAHSVGFSDWREPFVRLTYSSWVTPSTVIDYDPATDERHVRKQQPILGGYDPADYVQTREWVEAADGSRIPVSIVHHRSVAPRSDSPTLLYGYGAYEISYDPYVSIARLSLLDRGVVYAHAHIRGGGEMGRHWYDNGKMLHKKNTFSDYLDVARHLIASGWTSPSHLVGLGGSAGGLLMGAVVNDAPELFAGIVAQVPFVDALTTILDPSLPLSEIEWDEWGDPLHHADVYAYMKSYTPYENIRDCAYPAIYAITNINDTRVYYVEPAKWVAKLRATLADSRHILFKCEMSAGHGGASGRYDAWRQTADFYSWIIDVSGAARTAVSKPSQNG
ncbi:MAG TPA: S9 family peptidase [Nocardioidaceae bacterium]|nr:S9 family peptidase [Nocardioidaceae bacterium]